VCVECVRSAAVGQKCVECASPQSSQRVITAGELYGTGSLRRDAPVTFWLIVACVGVFVLSLTVPGVTQFGFQANQLVAQGEWWRMVTAAFLHGSILHIAFNMYALYLFGPQIERQVGGIPFLSLYLGSALAGGAAYYLAFALGTGAVAPAVGASGAIFGLFGATLAGAYRGRMTAAGRAGLRQLMVLLVINLALPLVVPAIAWQAHLGGLVAGTVIAFTWIALPRRRGSGGVVLRAVAGTFIGALSVLAVLVL
jgi:membrane associated rhomboid family serine protease